MNLTLTALEAEILNPSRGCAPSRWPSQLACLTPRAAAA